MGRKRGTLACWRICGYDSSTKIFEELIPVGQITQNNLEEMLRSLAGRRLSSRELVGAYAKRGTKGFNGALQIVKENDNVRRRTNYYCGQNPHYAATLVSIDQAMEEVTPML